MCKNDKIYQVNVVGFGREMNLIDLCNTKEQMQRMTVLQLKEKIAEILPGRSGEVVESLRLIFRNMTLDESSKLLSEYGIQHMSVIQTVMRVAGGLAA